MTAVSTPVPANESAPRVADEADWSCFRTAVVPAAGLGTRFLPATKTVPKELLPVVDTPGIELVAEEAAESGATRLAIVTSPGKDGVVAHFVEDLVLESKLEERGKFQLLEKVRRAPELLDVTSVVQEEPLGLGHAVAQAESVLDTDEQAIAVLLPDDLVLPRGVLDAMCRVRRQRGGTVLCAIEVPPEQVSAYGVFDVAPVPDSANPNVLRVKGMVEKPVRDVAPSHFAAAGRYILDRAIFDALRRITPGAGGELQLTDAIALLIADGHPVHVVVHRGSRHDLGNPGGYLRAAVDFALDSAEYGPTLREWLAHRLSDDWSPQLTSYE
jgi:UTP--glucose-1-phosphate uridylyltransferase